MCIEKGVKMKSLVARLVGLNILLFAGVGSWFGSWFGGNNDNYDNEKILIRDSSSYSYWEKDGVADSETANIKFSFTVLSLFVFFVSFLKLKLKQFVKQDI
jgi:hypothetical protein